MTLGAGVKGGAVFTPPSGRGVLPGRGDVSPGRVGGW